MNDDKLDALLDRAHALLERLEAQLPPMPIAPDFATHIAFFWQRRRGGGTLLPIVQPHRVQLDDLLAIEPQKQALVRNTRQFLAGLPANNALLWGSRGTGKSSLVKAVLNAYADQGLRLVEVVREQLEDLPELMALLAGQPQSFILFCDDLAFSEGETGYQHLKAMLEGSIAAPPANVLIYATSNRRHLLPEYLRENQDSRVVNGEIHHGEGVEEKISLSERFGLWLAFYPFDQNTYLEAVHHWLRRFDFIPDADSDRAALQWALARGGRSGRTAWQFARDWAGMQRLGNGPA